jgi:hypothetical protein
MKTHTYFLSGKALAIVAGALTTSGALVFVVGVFVGILIQEPRPAAPGAGKVDAPAVSAPIASNTMSSGMQSAESPAAWPFSVPVSAEPAAGTEAPAAAPGDSAPAKPKAKSDTTSARHTVSDVAFVVPPKEPAHKAPAADVAPFTVRVGIFRVVRNAQLLAERLESAGYKPKETVRMEGGRALHIVSVGGYTGRRAAILAAERIGDAVQLVAIAVPASSRR